MALVLDWKKKLGYRIDPFEQAAPIPASRYAVGFDELQERFNLFLIKRERLATVSGETGTGKTLFLAWAAEQLKAGYRTHFVDAHKHPGADALRDSLLSGSVSLFARALRNPLRKGADERHAALMKNLSSGKHVLLIDNAGSLSRDALALLDEILSQTGTHAVLADTKERLMRADVKGVHLALKTPAYTHEQLSRMLARRIAAAGGTGTFPFDEEQMDSLVRKADGSPARLLALARERAIELSLKVSSPPKGRAAAGGASAATHEQAPVKDKKVGFLNIKIERGPQAAAGEASYAHAQERSAALEDERESAPVPEAHAQDAQMLMDIVGKAENARPKTGRSRGKEQPDTKEYERAIRELTGELGGEKRKGAKRPAKKR